MSAHHVDVAHWAQTHPLEGIQVDCSVAVMLKILDGKCKMSATEKQVMELLYDQIRHLPVVRLDSDLHGLIATARVQLDEPLQTLIYEKRVLAETMISRPVMKAFKAMIRAQGLFDGIAVSDEDEELSPRG